MSENSNPSLTDSEYVELTKTIHLCIERFVLKRKSSPACVVTLQVSDIVSELPRHQARWLKAFMRDVVGVGSDKLVMELPIDVPHNIEIAEDEMYAVCSRRKSWKKRRPSWPAVSLIVQTYDRSKPIDDIRLEHAATAIGMEVTDHGTDDDGNWSVTMGAA